MSFPAFSGLFAILIAAAAAAPDDIPTWNVYNTNKIAIKILSPPNAQPLCGQSMSNSKYATNKS